jgi:small-conductance mechanosensitive channel
MDFYNYIESFTLTKAFDVSAVVLVLIIFYFGFVRTLNLSRMSHDKKRRTINNVRTSFFFIFIISVFFIFSNQLYSTILSFAALAAAFAIATKEFLLCFVGGFYRAFARPFTVGDRIQIEDTRGDVIDVGLLATQILEVGPGYKTHQFTGRTISVPNSTFLTHNVTNETSSPHSYDFVLHTFSLPIERQADWKKHNKALLDSAMEFSKEYIDDARAYFNLISTRRNLQSPLVEPQINVQLKEIDEITFTVRVTVPALLRGRIEQNILKSYLEKVLK